MIAAKLSSNLYDVDVGAVWRENHDGLMPFLSGLAGLPYSNKACGAVAQTGGRESVLHHVKTDIKLIKKKGGKRKN